MNNLAKGDILKLTFLDASKILDEKAKYAHALDDKWRDVSYESSNSTVSQDNEARDETMSQLSTQIRLLTKQIAEMISEKESSGRDIYNASPKCAYYVGQCGQSQEQYNQVQDQEEDANYVSSYQGGPNQQRTNHQ